MQTAEQLCPGIGPGESKATMPHALLVDDHSETLDALTELAQEQGFTVSTAERSTAPGPNSSVGSRMWWSPT